MKKILLAVALMASVAVANAQVKSAESIQKAIEKAQANALNEKKAAKADTWIKLGEAFMAAYGNPTANILGNGVSKQQLELVMNNEKPISKEQVVIGGKTYEKVVYKDKNLYFDGEILAITEVTKPSYDGDALAEALKAYAKAATLDDKGKKTKSITEAIGTIAGSYGQDAYTAYQLGNNAKASELFAKQADAAATAPYSKVDTLAIYYSGVMAAVSGNYPFAKKQLNRAMELGYYDEGGIYSNLFDCALAQKDTLGAKKILEEGFVKFPNNSKVLTDLINLYLTTKEDPVKLIALLGKAKEQMPDNASLYYVEGNIYGQLKDYDNALKSYRQCNEIDPNFDFGYFGEGMMWCNCADEIQEQAAALPDNQWKEYDELMKVHKDVLKNAVEPFEKCYAITKNDDLKSNAAVLLKQVYYLLRKEGTEYVDGYNKYNEIVTKSKGE